MRRLRARDEDADCGRVAARRKHHSLRSMQLKRREIARRNQSTIVVQLIQELLGRIQRIEMPIVRVEGQAAQRYAAQAI